MQQCAPSSKYQFVVCSFIKISIHRVLLHQNINSQLPEPLLLHSNYDDLIQIALSQQNNTADQRTLLERLHAVLLKLPKANRFTLRFILEHLHRVSLNEVCVYSSVSR